MPLLMCVLFTTESAGILFQWNVGSVAGCYKGELPRPMVVHVTFGFGYAWCIHIAHLYLIFIYLFISLFSKHLRTYYVQAPLVLAFQKDSLKCSYSYCMEVLNGSFHENYLGKKL